VETTNITLHSGGAQGAESIFGEQAEKFGINEVNYSFDGHITNRSRGIKILTEDELLKGDVSIDYVSRLMHRKYKETYVFKRILQTVFYQIFNSEQVFVVGNITEHQTVKGGTGWGAELAKILNRPLYVYDQDRLKWLTWTGKKWVVIDRPSITKLNFAGTGTRYIKDGTQQEIENLFTGSFESKVRFN
jgi:hypothetical protein